MAVPLGAIHELCVVSVCEYGRDGMSARAAAVGHVENMPFGSFSLNCANTAQTVIKQYVSMVWCMCVFVATVRRVLISHMVPQRSTEQHTQNIHTPRMFEYKRRRHRTGPRWSLLH